MHTVLGFESQLAAEIREGKDPHLSFAVNELLLNEDGTKKYTYEFAAKNKKQKDIKEARQFAKVFNFGAPGGLGAEGLVMYARMAYGVEMTVEQAKEIKQRWLRHYREMYKYFQNAARRTEETGFTTCVHPITKFVRGKVSYTEFCNQLFQNLIACCAKEAIWRIALECYTGRSVDGLYDGIGKVSPLFGSRQVMFIHDESICEHPEARAHEAGYRQAELMKQGMREYIKSVPVGSSPALMRKLYKDAEPVHDVNGRLVPWEPKEEAA